MRLRSALFAVRYRGAVTANSSLRLAKLIMTSLPSSSLAIDISGRWYDSLMRQRFCQSKIFGEAIRPLDFLPILCYNNMHKMFQYRLYPTRKQETKLNETLEECRWLYNYLLEKRKNAWEQRGESLTCYGQINTFPILKQERPLLKEVHSQV